MPASLDHPAGGGDGSSTKGLNGFEDAWSTTSRTDPRLNAAQDAIYDELYFRPAMDRDVLAPGDLPDHAGVALGPAAGDVAGDGGDGQHLQLGRGEGQQQGHGVIHAGVAVDDQGQARHRL